MFAGLQAAAGYLILALLIGMAGVGFLKSAWEGVQLTFTTRVLRGLFFVLFEVIAFSVLIASCRAVFPG
jgi:hypothetical protein